MATAESSNTENNINAAQTAVSTLVDGLAKNHLQARINKLKKTVYVGIHNFSKTTGATDDTVTCLVNLKNMDTSNPQNDTVILARYQGNQLVGVALTPIANAPIAAGTQITRTVSISVPKNLYGENLAFYVWSDALGAKPHINKYSYTLSAIQ